VGSTRRGPFRALEEKLAIVAEYEEADRAGRGEVLRRHGLGRTTVARWSYSRDHGEFGPGRTGRRPAAGSAMTPRKQSEEIVRLRRELAKAQADRAIVDAALESLGKAHALLEKLSESAEDQPLQTRSEKTPPRPSSPTD
jgi:transposase